MLYDYAVVVCLLSHVWLFVILCGLLGSSVLGIIKVRVLQCIVISFSRGSSGSRGWTRVSCLVEGFFTTVGSPRREVKLLSRVWLCNSMDCSLPGSYVHGIFQARVVEWVAISFSRGSSRPGGLNPGLPHCRQTLYPLSHQGSPSQPKIILIMGKMSVANIWWRRTSYPVVAI